MSNIRRTMMAAGRRGGSAVDWESIARGLIDSTTQYSVDLPSGLTTVREYLFRNTQLTAFTMPTSVTTIGTYAFAGCTLLSELPIGDGVTSIGVRAFQNCTGVQEVIVPNSVAILNDYAFMGCHMLYATIGTGVTDIKQGCFYSCGRLVYVRVLATTPPTLGNNAFASTSNCPIYVPDASVAAYKAANNWSSLASRIFPMSDLTT